MSWQPANDPNPAAPLACAAIETVIIPRPRDIGGFEVRRALPVPRRRMVGPFIFWDQMGPALFGQGTGLDVAPHPHIGLATVTYLFEGEIIHRDSLGVVEAIQPGALNLMAAGRGVAHSERTGPAVRAAGGILSGIQAWLALPASVEDGDPSFHHLGAHQLPVVTDHGLRLRLILGQAYGARSPAITASETVYADIQLSAGASLPLDPEIEERGLYTVSGTIDIAGDQFAAGQLLVFRPGDRITVTAVDAARVMLLGGAAMDGPRHVWWNFVSSRADRIEQAKDDWRHRRFPEIPGETEFIPLPER
ncbi:MAG: hypothetical protein GC191_04750 [Azospirillum sp.]|nr:hypothetical protein [Azospirillum sp.]